MVSHLLSTVPAQVSADTAPAPREKSPVCSHCPGLAAGILSHLHPGQRLSMPRQKRLEGCPALVRAAAIPAQRQVLKAKLAKPSPNPSCTPSQAQGPGSAAAGPQGHAAPGPVAGGSVQASESPEGPSPGTTGDSQLCPCLPGRPAPAFTWACPGVPVPWRGLVRRCAEGPQGQVRQRQELSPSSCRLACGPGAAARQACGRPLARPGRGARREQGSAVTTSVREQCFLSLPLRGGTATENSDGQP